MRGRACSLAVVASGARACSLGAQVLIRFRWLKRAREREAEAAAEEQKTGIRRRRRRTLKPGEEKKPTPLEASFGVARLVS